MNFGRKSINPLYLHHFYIHCIVVFLVSLQWFSHGRSQARLRKEEGWRLVPTGCKNPQANSNQS